MPLVVIGTALNPHPFMKKSGQELELDFHANKKPWMNKKLFYAWLILFQNKIGRTEGRKFLLLIDNCTASGKKKTMPLLLNVWVECLLVNTTRKVQPLDSGIIYCVKAKYESRLILRVFDNIDIWRKSNYNVEILCAMR